MPRGHPFVMEDQVAVPGGPQHRSAGGDEEDGSGAAAGCHAQLPPVVQGRSGDSRSSGPDDVHVHRQA
jgi:hypothetical protein